jgi:hypothetical protein
VQELSNAARRRAAGMLEAGAFMEVEAAREAAAALSAEEAAAQAERQYAAELQKELAGGPDAADDAARGAELPTEVCMCFRPGVALQQLRFCHAVKSHLVTGECCWQCVLSGRAAAALRGQLQSGS